MKEKHKHRHQKHTRRFKNVNKKKYLLKLTSNSNISENITNI